MENDLLAFVRERLSEADRDRKESHAEAMNSYGAGYDQGFYDALAAVLAEITGETV